MSARAPERDARIDHRLHKIAGTNHHLVMRWFVRGQPEPYRTEREALEVLHRQTERRAAP
ncbi:MAG: hypothetical protein Q8M01_06790 [Rubrivivax sp.]|nr:hypothetical protein [Rubrivivax sp.]